MTHPDRPQRIPGGYMWTRTTLGTAIEMTRDSKAVAALYYTAAQLGMWGLGRAT